MSKQSINPLPKQLADFLSLVCEGNDWKSWLEPDEARPVEHTSTSVLLDASTKEGVYIRLSLIRHNKQNIFLVSDFKIDGVRVGGLDVLAHLGKRRATSGGDQDDYASGNLEDLYTIVKAKNLEALLREHDNLSRLHRVALLFDLP